MRSTFAKLLVLLARHSTGQPPPQPKLTAPETNGLAAIGNWRTAAGHSLLDAKLAPCSLLGFRSWLGRMFEVFFRKLLLNF